MREVQTALKDLIDDGLYVAHGAWMPSEGNINSPSEYVVYSVAESEDEHCDDCVTGTVHFVYMDLWTEDDPTDLAEAIRERMYAHGFSMVQMTDRGYNQPRWSHMTRQHCIYMTWRYRRRVHYELGCQGA